MNVNKDVMERQFHAAGAIFLKAGQENTGYAYIIQAGEVVTFVEEHNKAIEVNRYGRGAIIAESNLLTDDAITMNYQALSDTNLIMINRHEFEQKLNKVESSVLRIIQALVRKISGLEGIDKAEAIRESQNDDKAYEIVSYLLRDMSKERKDKYEEILLPHFNVMCKALESLKKEERHARQKLEVAAKVEAVKDDGEE